MYEDPKSKISQLEKVLDSREDRVSKKVKRHELHPHESTIPEDWDKAEFASPAAVGLEVNIASKPGFSGSTTSLSANSSKKGLSIVLKVLIGSVIFFAIAIVVVFYKFFLGGNIVSGDNISVTVKAPISIAGGEVLPLEIEVRNNNNVTLSGADLSVNFPNGSMNADNAGLPVNRDQIFLGDINPGQSVIKNTKVVLYGSENEKKTINLSLQYKVAGSNSLFNKTKDVIVLVTSAPVSIVIHGQNEVNTNQVANFTVDVISNSTSVIKNLLLKATYPFGFTFGDSNPSTFSNNNSWVIGDLAPGEKRTIHIAGTVTGQEGEERSFNFSLGTQSSSDATAIQTPLTSAFSALTIRSPFVSADVFFNGKNGMQYVTSAGDKIETIIKWKNNLPYKVSNVSITVRLNGNAIDKSSVQADTGFYKSIDNTVVFDKTTDSTFASLEPGQSGQSKFNMKSFGVSSVTGAGLTNPTITLAIAVQGKTVDNHGTVQDVSFADTRSVKVTTNPRLFAKSLYFVGPFKNSGPLPAKAETETTFTVTWTVTNPLNNISNAYVVATLPPYIKWLDNISPIQEKLSYDSNTGQVVWNLGNISAGAGSISSAREVSFQLSMLPSVSQIGTSPDLTSSAVLTAKDAFAGTNVSSVFQAINTELVNDPYFRVDTQNVVK